jgi:hypothetical protein
MSSPSTSKAVSGPPAFPPEPVTPTRGAGKGKRTSAAAELTPHSPRAGPSLAGPSMTASQAPKAPRVSWASSQASVASSAPPAHSFSEPPVKDPIPPPRHKHTGNLLKVLDHSIDILGEWSGKSWSTPRDQMHLACSILVLVRIATNNRWHTQPFEDTPNASTLASECRGLFPTPGSTPGTTHRSADKAGHQIQIPSLPLACCAPSDTMAHPAHDQCSPLPPWPSQSDWHPSPPRTPFKEVLCRHHL